MQYKIHVKSKISIETEHVSLIRICKTLYKTKTKLSTRQSISFRLSFSHPASSVQCIVSSIQLTAGSRRVNKVSQLAPSSNKSRTFLLPFTILSTFHVKYVVVVVVVAEVTIVLSIPPYTHLMGILTPKTIQSIVYSVVFLFMYNVHCTYNLGQTARDRRDN